MENPTRSAPSSSLAENKSTNTASAAPPSHNNAADMAGKSGQPETKKPRSGGDGGGSSSSSSGEDTRAAHPADVGGAQDFDVGQLLRGASKGQTDVVVAMLGDAAEHVRENAASEALLYAASNGRVDTLCALIRSCGAQVEHASDNGWTAIMYAARHGHSDVVVALAREFGASSEKATSVGRTAIMYAASQGHTDTVRTLCEQCGANPRRTDASGLTAIMYAKAAGHTETARVLEVLSQQARQEKDGAVRKRDQTIRCEPTVTEKLHHDSEPPQKDPEPPQQAVLQSAQTVRAPRIGRRLLTSHLPRKVSTPLPSKMPSGPCAEGGGLWTITETAGSEEAE